MTQKTVAVDFDGVLHSYTSGGKGVDQIPDAPIAGAFDFLEALHRRGFRIAKLGDPSREVAYIQGSVDFAAHWRLVGVEV